MLLTVLSAIASLVGVVGFVVTEVRAIRARDARWSSLIWAAVAIVAVGIAAYTVQRERERTAVADHAERVLEELYDDGERTPAPEAVFGSGIAFFSQYREEFPDLARRIDSLQRRVDADLPLAEDPYDTRSQEERDRRAQAAEDRVRGMLEAVAEGDVDPERF
jgi:hypothetical protein